MFILSYFIQSADGVILIDPDYFNKEGKRDKKGNPVDLLALFFLSLPLSPPIYSVFSLYSSPSYCLSSLLSLYHFLSSCHFLSPLSSSFISYTLFTSRVHLCLRVSVCTCVCLHLCLSAPVSVCTCVCLHMCLQCLPKSWPDSAMAGKIWTSLG